MEREDNNRQRRKTPKIVRGTDTNAKNKNTKPNTTQTHTQTHTQKGE